MKKLFIIALIVSALAYIYFIFFGQSTDMTILTKQKTKVADSKEQVKSSKPGYVSLDGENYQFYYKKVMATDSLSLIPNFDTHRTSSEIQNAEKCTFGINGGFYTEGGAPLGLFFTSGKYLENLARSSTFNGIFLSQNHSQILKNLRMISEEGWSEDMQYGNGTFAFQSGPLYDLTDSTTTHFEDKSFARRNLAAQDKHGQIYFFTIFNEKSRYSGPRLEDIPRFFGSEMIAEIADFQTVLNLDGGSASVYFDTESDVHIKELKYIGSLICGK